MASVGGRLYSNGAVALSTPSVVAMSHPYHLLDVASVVTPALVFFPAMIRRNIREVVAMAGGPHRLRPHAKTHKCPEVVKLQLAEGVTKHKCATIAEAEMLAAAGATDVLIAYPMVGPNVKRVVALAKLFPHVAFSVIADHSAAIKQLSEAATAVSVVIGVLPDINGGMDRTGTTLAAAGELYRLLFALPGIAPAGLHLYDGHNNMESRADREAAVRATLTPVLELRDRLVAAGFAVPRIVAGGTPAFPVYAAMQEVPDLESSPGTYVLHDAGYGSKYPDFGQVQPAAVLVTRVVSRPTPTRVTFDLGTKAVAADPPMAKRIALLDFPPHTPVGHNEEHYVVETPHADRFVPGDVAYALPAHICPTVALHREALTAADGRITGAWPITARDRRLTV
jgi:D-serine deaminase-like pyridoxal phosphate-dependent protein